MEFFMAQDHIGPVSMLIIFFVPALSMLLIMADDHVMNSFALIATAWG
jgi:hypothetical protein